MIQDSGDLLPFQIDTEIPKAENLNPFNIDQHIAANEVKDLAIENLNLKLRESAKNITRRYPDFLGDSPF